MVGRNIDEDLEGGACHPQPHGSPAAGEERVLSSHEPSPMWDKKVLQPGVLMWTKVKRHQGPWPGIGPHGLQITSKRKGVKLG